MQKKVQKHQQNHQAEPLEKNSMAFDKDFLLHFNTQRSEVLSKFSSESGYLGEQLFADPEKNLSQANIAIFGIDDTRNAFPMPYSASSDYVRYWLYQLSAFNNLKVVDLGTMVQGNTVIDSKMALSHIVETLISNNVIPIIIGGTHDFTIPMIKGLLATQKRVEYCLFDSRFDLQYADKGTNSRSFLKQLLMETREKAHANIMGYQSYYVTQSQIDELSDAEVDLYRLGIVRSQLNQMEPIIRDSDAISFDLSVIRQSDMPSTTNPGPNGLYTEEACQLAFFAGMSDYTKAFATFELVSKHSPLDISAHLNAQIIWHYMYGISQRKGDYPVGSIDNYQKIIVKIEGSEVDMVFYKSPLSGRYWFENPSVNGKHIELISCSKEDYVALSNGDIPIRIQKCLCGL